MQVIDPDPVLGEPLAHFPSDRLRPLITAGAVVAPVALALDLTTAQASEWWGPALTVAIMAVVGLAAGWYVLHGWNREIILYEGGFSYREGSRTVYFRYEEIAGIRLRAERLAYFGGVIRRDRYRFVVTTWQGDRFVITNLYRRAAELGTRLTEQVNRVLQPVISRRLAAGETVHFSEQVAVNQNGISSGGSVPMGTEQRSGSGGSVPMGTEQRSGSGGSVLRWDDFGGYKLSSGRLLLMDKGGNVAIAEQLWEIDNVTLLLEILKARNHKGDAFS